jgi:signal recognition particle subunit SRP54
MGILFGMIDSMTPEEKKNPKLIDQSRRRRIAAGSGVEPHQVNEMVKQYDVMAQMMKAMAGKGGRERMQMFQELQGGLAQGGTLTRPKQGTGKRLTPAQKAKLKKTREQELRKRRRRGS